jgi:putative transposase
MPASGPDQALERFRIIRPFLEEGIALAAIARQQGIAVRTARRLVSQYRAGGLAALTRSPRAGKGSHRALSRALQELVEALALTTPRRSVAALHRTASAVAKDRGDTPPGYAASTPWCVPSIRLC